MRTLFLLVPISLFAASCASHSGGQTGEATVGCLPVHTMDLALTDASPLGFSAADALAIAGGDHALTLAWAKGGQTPATLGLTQSGTIQYQDREWIEPASSSGAHAAIGVDCRDIVQIQATLTLHSDDGAFDESWPIALDADTAHSSSAYYTIELGTLHGSYAVTEVDPTQYEKVTASLSLRFDDSGAHGTIMGQASRSEANGTASALNFAIASF